MAVGIHILNRNTEEITGYYTNNSKKMMVLSNVHARNRDEHSETFDFTVPYKYLDDFHNQNRVLIPDVRKGEYREFVIKHKETSDKEIFIQCDGAWLDDLASSSEPLPPVNLNNVTVDEAVTYAISSTNYDKGEIEFDGFIDLVITEYTRPYDLLLKIEELTDLQFDVTIETSGNEITGRYVHMRESDDISEFTGKELVRGKDIVTIKQKENTRELVTALKLTSTDKDGKPLVTEVYDDDAIDRWGSNGMPIWGLHHFEANEKSNMTIEKMKITGKKILKEKIDSVIEYEVQAIEIVNQLGMTANFGDRVRVRDVTYTPHFYLEATVKAVQRDIFDDNSKELVLGSIKKYSESALRTYFNSLKSQLQSKMNDNIYNIDQTVIEIKDSVSIEGEKVRLKTLLMRLEKDKAVNLNSYNDLVNNKLISANIKSELISTKSAYDRSLDVLINQIATALNDNIVVPSETLDINSEVANYNTALSNLTLAIQKCLNSISETMAVNKSKEAVNGLEIGGRNLLIGSNKLDTFVKLYGVTATSTLEPSNSSRTSNLVHLSNIVRTNGDYVFFFPLDLIAPLFGTDLDTYTLSFYIKTNNKQIISFAGNNMTGSLLSGSYTDTTPKKISITLTPKMLKSSAPNYNLHVLLNGAGLTDIWIYDIKLEKGTKATDWSPAPEDIDAQFATLTKETGELRTAVQGLQGTINSGFADGIVTEAEAKAINQSRLQLEKEKKDIDGQYLGIYGSADLTDEVIKGDLKTAKDNYDISHGALVGAINEAIKDGKATPQESILVTSRFSDYSDKIGILSEKLNLALDRLSLVRAEKIRVGGKNILNNSDFSLGSKNWGIYGGTVSYEIIDGYSVAKLTNASHGGIHTSSHVNLIEADIYTLSFKAKSIGTTSRVNIGLLNQPAGHSNIFDINNTWKNYSYVFTLPTNISISTIFHIFSTTTSQQGFYITQVQLEKGNKATDWTPSLADVNDSIAEKTPKKEIIATINASGENVTIDGAKININGNTTFSNTYKDVNGIKDGTTQINPNVMSNYGITTTTINGGKITANSMTLNDLTINRPDGVPFMQNGMIKNEYLVTSTFPAFMSSVPDGKMSSLHFFPVGTYYGTTRNTLAMGGTHYTDFGRLTFYRFYHAARYVVLRAAVNVKNTGGVLMIRNSDSTIYEISAVSQNDSRADSNGEVYINLVEDLGKPTYERKSFYVFFKPNAQGDNTSTALIRIMECRITDYL